MLVLHEELGDELLHVSWVRQATGPLLLDPLEEPVRIVKLPSLELDHQLGVGPDDKADHVAGAAIVGAVQVSVFVGELMVPREEVIQSLLAQGAYWLSEISIRVFFVAQVEDLRVVVLEDPGKDGVLRHVLSASLGVGVDQGQVLEVGDLTIHPLVRVDGNVSAFCFASSWNVF